MLIRSSLGGLAGSFLVDFLPYVNTISTQIFGQILLFTMFDHL